jgi:hypothetical protein
MAMWMWFHAAIDDTVLFKFWHITTVADMVWSCVIVLVVGFLLEALKYWRLILERKSVEYQ